MTYGPLQQRTSGTTRVGFRNREAADRRVSPHLLRSFQNMKIGTIQALACVGLGTMLGFIAATKGFSPSSRADGPTPATRQAGAGTGATGQGVDEPSLHPGGVARNVM